MKKLCVWTVLMCLLGSSALAATVDTWVGPTGSWMSGSPEWQNGGPTTWTSTSSSDEIKITNDETVCTIDSDAGAEVYRLSIASGPTGSTVEVVAGGSLEMGEVRVGARGATGDGSIGYVNQTGGMLVVSDLIVGRYGSSGPEPPQGFYTMSGGILTYSAEADGRLYIGAGNNHGYTEGTFTVIGTDPNILFDSLYVGSDDTDFGKGTLAFQVDASGVAPVVIDDRINLDLAGDNSTALLEVSGTTGLPDADLILVHCTSAQALLGTFDAINGVSVPKEGTQADEYGAEEGTLVQVGDNVYSLTYQYDVDGDSNNNDIALVYVAGIEKYAHDPDPAHRADPVYTTQESLSWTNATGGGDATLYFGTDPNRPDMDVLPLGTVTGVSTVDLTAGNFPNFAPIEDQTWYYWVVDYYQDPNGGLMWSFHVDNNTEPNVNAGGDQVLWQSESDPNVIIHLNGTVIEDGLPNPPGEYTVLWTQVENDAPTVMIVPNNVEDPNVTVTERGVYEFMLTANDSVKQASDTVQIIVGETQCDASHMSSEEPPYDLGDINRDCIVDVDDLAQFVLDWLNCTDEQTYCGF